jgi:hypothetical protein
MQNSHLRLGRLEYLRSGAKTNTHIFVRVSHYMGDDAQAHLLSYFGNDAEVAAVTAAIQEKHLFDLHFPDGSKQRMGFGADPSCYKASLYVPALKRSYRHVVALSSMLHANGSAGQTFVLNDDPGSQDVVWATLVSVLGLPADPRWGKDLLNGLMNDGKVTSLEGIGCSPAMIQVTREEMLDRIGNALSAEKLPFPEASGPVTWPDYDLKAALAPAT